MVGADAGGDRRACCIEIASISVSISGRMVMRAIATFSNNILPSRATATAEYSS